MAETSEIDAVPKVRKINTHPTWREVSANDLKSLLHVADKIHPDLPESEEVFAERVKLFPEGCLALVNGERGELFGYVISHPIRRRQPPELDTLLGEIAPDANQYYIHDLAILPELQGRGLAQACISRILSVADRFPTTCLVSVYDTVLFWYKFGFNVVQEDEILKEKLVGYGDDAKYRERQNEKHI